MSLITKIRPGAFGLLLLSISLSTIATTAFKSTTRPTVAPASTQGNIARAAAGDAEADNPDSPTYHEYQIEIELENLARLIKAEARTRLDAGVTQEQVDGAIAALANEPATPENTARRLYLLRTLQTLKGEAAPPEVEAIEIPTVEGYRDAIGE